MNLEGVDQVAVVSAGDLPGKTTKDLLAILLVLGERSVDLYLHHEQIDTSNCSAFTLLDIITAYRRAKRSQSIKAGQSKAIAAGKVIGRPTIPPGVVDPDPELVLPFAEGAGIRPTARKFNVSPASVVTIRQSMTRIDVEAA